MIGSIIIGKVIDLIKGKKRNYIRVEHVYDCYKIIEPDATVESMIIDLDLQYIVVCNDIPHYWINNNTSVVVKNVEYNPKTTKLYVLESSINKHRDLKSLVSALWEYR